MGSTRVFRNRTVIISLTSVLQDYAWVYLGTNHTSHQFASQAEVCSCTPLSMDTVPWQFFVCIAYLVPAFQQR
jgi:hypothetical protein